MEKEDRIRKLMQEVNSLRDLLSRVEGEREKRDGDKGDICDERVDLLKKIRERKIIDDDIPPF